MKTCMCLDIDESKPVLWGHIEYCGKPAVAEFVYPVAEQWRKV